VHDLFVGCAHQFDFLIVNLSKQLTDVVSIRKIHSVFQEIVKERSVKMSDIISDIVHDGKNDQQSRKGSNHCIKIALAF